MSWRDDRLAAIQADEAEAIAQHPEGSLPRIGAELHIACRRLGVEIAAALRIPQLVGWISGRIGRR